MPGAENHDAKVGRADCIAEVALDLIGQRAIRRHGFERQVDHTAATLSEARAERKSPHGLHFGAAELPSRNIDRRVLEMTAADGADHVVAGHQHPRPGGAGGRAFRGFDRDQHATLVRRAPCPQSRAYSAQAHDRGAIDASGATDAMGATDGLGAVGAMPAMGTAATTAPVAALRTAPIARRIASGVAGAVSGGLTR